MTVTVPVRVRSVLWIALLAVGIVSAGIVAARPAGDPMATALVIGLQVASVAALARFIRGTRPSPVLPWIVFLAGVVAFAVADVLLAVLGGGHDRGGLLIGATYVGVYVTMIAGLALLARAFGAGRDRGELVDGLIVAAGVGVVVWALPLGTRLTSMYIATDVKIGALVFPTLDLVMVALGAMIFLRLGRITVAVLLFSAAIVAQLAADTLCAMGQLGHSVPTESLASPLYAVQFACFGAAMLHPSAAELAHFRPSGIALSPRIRLALISVAAIAASLVALSGRFSTADLVVQGVTDSLASAIVILFAARAWILTDQLSNAHATLVRTESDLKAHTEFVAGISEAIPGALFAGDPATLANDYASQGLRTLLGVDPASAIGKPGWILERIHPDDREGFVARCTATRTEGRPSQSYELRLRTESGDYRHVAATLRYMAGPSGKVDRYVGVGIDVTDRVEAERHLHEREAFIANLVQVSSAIVISAHRGRDGEVIDFISPSIEQVLGYRPEEIVGIPGFVQSRIHPDEASGRERQLDGSAASGGGVIRATRRLRARDGSYRYLELSSRVEADGDGVVRYITSGVDVTDRVRLEAELARSLAFVDRILETNPGAVLVGRLGDDELEYISPSTRQMLGYRPDEIVGVQGWGAAHTHPDDLAAFAAATERVMREGSQTFSLTLRLRSTDGTYHPLLAIVRPFVGDDGAPRYVATAIDISDRVAMEEEIREARDAAEAADRAKSEFLSLMSHEFRTPLNSILGFGRLLDESDLPPEDRESVGYILRSGTTLLGMIDRVLDFARLETGRLDLTTEPVLAGDIVRRALELVRPRAADRHAVIDDQSARDEVVVRANGQRLVTVVWDLLDNAIHHGGAGVHVTVGAESVGGGLARIRVIDDGVGMDEDQLRHVFSPFEAGRDGGASLGLSLGRRLVEAMGGTLDIESSPGHGTTSTITLPEGHADDREPDDRGTTAHATAPG